MYELMATLLNLGTGQNGKTSEAEARQVQACLENHHGESVRINRTLVGGRSLQTIINAKFAHEHQAKDAIDHIKYCINGTGLGFIAEIHSVTLGKAIYNETFVPDSWNAAARLASDNR